MRKKKKKREREVGRGRGGESAWIVGRGEVLVKFTTRRVLTPSPGHSISFQQW
jgi:hypothetical protein